jgi:hypothetical protein
LTPLASANPAARPLITGLGTFPLRNRLGDRSARAVALGQSRETHLRRNEVFRADSTNLAQPRSS